MTGKETNEALVAAASKAFSTPFDAVLKLAPESGQPLWIDGRKTPPVISAKAPKGVQAGCCWRGEKDAVTRALVGGRALESAYVSGRVAISGDMSVMARITLEEQR